MKNNLLSFANGLVLSMLALTWIGCSTMDKSRVSAPPPMTPHAEAATRDGLKITVDPFISKDVYNKETFKAYFGIAKPGPKLLILYVTADNSPTGGSWIIRKEGARLMSGETSRTATAGPDLSSQVAAGETMANVGAFLLSFPLLIPGNLMATDATVVQHNFFAREWLNTTIYPGEKHDGFLYFELDEKKPGTRYTLVINALNPASQETIALTLPFNYENP